MKGSVRVLTSFVFLAVASVPAQSFNVSASFSRSLASAIATSRARADGARTVIGADYAISKMDPEIVKMFNRAWQRAGNGASPAEAVVLILRMADGSFSGRDMGATNEYKQFTFHWHPAAIAIVHTHPNSSQPEPYGADIAAADHHGVPIFTITSRGMYVYDPGTRKISRVMDNLSWLEQTQWNKTVFATH